MYTTIKWLGNEWSHMNYFTAPACHIIRSGETFSSRPYWAIFAFSCRIFCCCSSPTHRIVRDIYIIRCDIINIRYRYVILFCQRAARNLLASQEILEKGAFLPIKKLTWRYFLNSRGVCAKKWNHTNFQHLKRKKVVSKVE